MTERRGRLTALGLGLALLLALAGCDDEAGGGNSASSSTSSPRQDVREVPDPCEAIDPAEVAALVGVREVEAAADGAPNYRGCTYTDTATNVVVLTSTVYASSADFEQIWASVVDSIQAETTNVEVPGAEGARVIVAADEQSLAVSGVAAANGIVDQVNLLAPAPYDRDAQIAAITVVLERLVAHSSPA